MMSHTANPQRALQDCVRLINVATLVLASVPSLDDADSAESHWFDTTMERLGREITAAKQDCEVLAASLRVGHDRVTLLSSLRALCDEVEEIRESVYEFFGEQCFAKDDLMFPFE